MDWNLLIVPSYGWLLFCGWAKERGRYGAEFWIAVFSPLIMALPFFLSFAVNTFLHSSTVIAIDPLLLFLYMYFVLPIPGMTWVSQAFDWRPKDEAARREIERFLVKIDRAVALPYASQDDITIKSEVTDQQTEWNLKNDTTYKRRKSVALRIVLRNIANRTYHVKDLDVSLISVPRSSSFRDRLSRLMGYDRMGRVTFSYPSNTIHESLLPGFLSEYDFQKAILSLSDSKTGKPIHLDGTTEFVSRSDEQEWNLVIIFPDYIAHVLERERVRIESTEITVKMLNGETVHANANFGDYPDSQLKELVNTKLRELGLYEIWSGVVPNLIQCLAHENPGVRQAAIAALGELKADTAVKPLLALIEKRLVGREVLLAAEALASIGDPIAIPVLREEMRRNRNRVELEIFGKALDSLSAQVRWTPNVAPPILVETADFLRLYGFEEWAPGLMQRIAEGA